ncbi:MAG TPA: hypothetical protein VJM83_00445, partial [Nitrospirota bacterium]|nr:hypothetical protein [Nitrospirota bacterium]
EFKRTTNEFKDNLETEVGTTKIKEELLNQQKEIQQSLAAAALKFAEEKPVETEEEYQAKAQTAEAEAAAAPQPGPPAPPAPETPDDEKPADPAVKAAPAAKADA